MYNTIYEKVLPSGDKVKVRVSHFDLEYKIDDIALIKKGKRKEIYLSHEITDRYEYRRLNITDRRKYMMNEFIKVTGVDVLNEALQYAWTQAEPLPIKAEDYE